MYENSFGVPDTLPAGYGGAQSEPASVHPNALGTSVLSRPQQQPARQPEPPRGRMRVVPNPPPGFHQMPAVPGVVRLSDVENEFDEHTGPVYEYGASDFDPSFDYEYEFYEGYGGYGAADSGPPIFKDKKLKLNYRDWDDGKGYIYRQYSNGSYAIIQGAPPKGVTAGVPFTAKQNSKAFAAIKAQVEGAIGVFPAGAKPSKPSKKKGKKKKGKKVDVGKLAQTSLEVAGKVAKKFEASGQAAEPTDAAETDAAAAAPAPSDDDMPWYAKRVFGLPMWGVVVGGVVVAGGLYFALKKPSVPSAPVPPSAPAPRRAAARAALPAAPAPSVAVAEDEE